MCIRDRPSTINLQNYIDAWQKMEFPRAFANTLFITAMSVFLIVLFGSMAGYALARTSSKLGGRLFLFFLAGLVVPFQMNIVSLYKIVKALHLMNSPFAVILVDVAVNMPQAVFLFREFVHSTVPVELEEAAEKMCIRDSIYNALDNGRPRMTLKNPVEDSQFLLYAFEDVWAYVRARL